MTDKSDRLTAALGSLPVPDTEEQLQSIQRRLGVNAGEAMRIQLEGPAGGAKEDATISSSESTGALEPEQVQLLAWAVSNCHMLARRALAKTTSVYDREKWEHVLRICEKAGARSEGVLRAALPTEITEGSALLSRSAQEPPKGYDVEASLQGSGLV